ncbi:MAG: EamA family transporter [Blastopirellula sp.]|nr:MAG: EamA family transporter [Blastopirellula sp.]
MIDQLNPNVKGAVTALLAFGIFASHDVIIKFLGGEYSAFQIAFFSGIFGFPVVLLMLIGDRSDGNLIPRHPYWTALRTICAVATGISAFYAFSVLPLAQTYALLFVTPLLITVLAIPILGETVGIHRWAAVVIGLIGVIIVLRPGQEGLSSGHLAALIAAICGAIASIIVRKIGDEERPIVLLLYPMFANIFLAGAFLPFVYRPMPVEHLGMLVIVAAFGLAASLLIILAFRNAEAVVVAPMQYTQIMWAAFFGFFLFGERPDMATGIGAAIIVSSGIYIVLREGHSGNSENQPVLQTRGRNEVGTAPRSSILERLRRANQDVGVTARRKIREEIQK